MSINCSAVVLMSLQPSTLAARSACPADGGQLSDPDAAFWVSWLVVANALGQFEDGCIA